MSHRVVYRLVLAMLLFATLPDGMAASSSLPAPGGEAEPAAPISLVRVVPSAATAPAGATFNVTVSFLATAHVSTDYTLELSLVDAHGIVVSAKHDTLNNNLIILPTSRWSGPVAITLPLTIPLSARGTLSLALALAGPRGPVALTAPAGTRQDDQHRYTVGAIEVRASAPTPRLTPPAPFDLSRYVLTFDDEFTTASISDAAENDHSRWYSQNEQCCMMTTDKTRTVMAPRSGPHNPFLLAPGGHGLIIRLQRTGDLWTSGVLTSVDSKGRGFSQRYGYYEMRARFPPGLNTWPAFWLLNTASKSSGAPAGEIDIVEYIANPAFPRYIATTLHDWSDRTTPAMSHHMVDLLTDGSHTYGMLWTATTMTFYFDGAMTFQCPTPAIMHQPYYLLVDLGIGGGWPTEGTPARNDLLVEWIRVYKER